MTIRISDDQRDSMLSAIDTDLNLGFLYIYSGSQPSSSADAASGTLLCVISNAGGATGLTFESPVDGVLAKTAAETWSGTAIASGTAGWFRFQALNTNETNTRADANAASSATTRIDGSIAVSGGDLNVSSTTFAQSAVQTISSFQFTLSEA